MRRMIVAREFSDYPEKWHFAPVLDTGDFVFLSGVTGVRPDLSVSDDPETQFRDAFQFVATHLEAAGLGFGHVAEMTTYHVGLRKHLRSFVKVKDEFVKEPFPAWTAVGVTELISEGTLLEIRIIAKRSGDRDAGAAPITFEKPTSGGVA
jgi:enamine deaminase RidA (YjgF/YER057c/UK114 family)